MHSTIPSQTTTPTLTIEWAPFTVAEGVDEATLLAASEVLQQEFVSQQPGFIRRELLKQSDREYVDIVYWSSREAADQAAKNATEYPACFNYFSLMVGVDHDQPEAGILHLAQVKAYQ